MLDMLTFLPARSDSSSRPGGGGGGPQSLLGVGVLRFFRTAGTSDDAPHPPQVVCPPSSFGSDVRGDVGPLYFGPQPVCEVQYLLPQVHVQHCTCLLFAQRAHSAGTAHRAPPLGTVPPTHMRAHELGVGCFCCFYQLQRVAGFNIPQQGEGPPGALLVYSLVVKAVFLSLHLSAPPPSLSKQRSMTRNGRNQHLVLLGQRCCLHLRDTHAGNSQGP